MADRSFKAFVSFAIRVIVVHTVTYFVFGMIMSNVFDYGRVFQQEIIRDFMRPMESTSVFLGPILQPVRGLLYAIGLWPIRGVILEKKHGWLIVWGIFVLFGILGTPAASPSSMEGVIYSKLPLWYHLMGLPEILLQTLAFSFLLVWWDRHQFRPRPAVQKGAFGADLLKAVMIGCFAYMGYAVGSLLTAFLAKVRVDMEAAAADWKTQIMFVVALVVNVLLILLVSGWRKAGKISVWQVFLLFWIVDALVPLAYQWLFTSPMSLPFAALIGLLPALVITGSVALAYKRGAPAMAAERDVPQRPSGN